MKSEALSKAFECVSATHEATIFPESGRWYVLMELDKYKEKIALWNASCQGVGDSAVEKINKEIAHIAHIEISENPSIDNVFSYDTLEDTVSKEDMT